MVNSRYGPIQVWSNLGMVGSMNGHSRIGHSRWVILGMDGSGMVMLGTVVLGVPDHASQIRDVLVRRIFSSGNPRGSGIWNGEGMERGRSVYEQPGTKVDGILSRQGGFPSK
jgi:hypothetical protein